MKKKEQICKRIVKSAREENLAEAVKKWATGLLVISVVGVLSYGFLFLSMMII